MQLGGRENSVHLHAMLHMQPGSGRQEQHLTFGQTGMCEALTSARSRAASCRRSALTDTHSARRPPSAQCCLMSAAIWRPLPTPAPAGRCGWATS